MCIQGMHSHTHIFGSPFEVKPSARHWTLYELRQQLKVMNHCRHLKVKTLRRTATTVVLRT